MENKTISSQTPRNKWLIPKQCLSGQVRSLASELSVPPLIAELVLARGFSSSDLPGARRFLSPDLRNLHDPFLMQGMEQATDRISRAITSREHILLYGDYDVDGITGVAVLSSIIRNLGGTVSTYLPRRLQEGYGVSEQGIREAAEMGVSLIITVDCGITAAPEVALASSLGLDCIITDHHEPKDPIPQAIAVLDPKREDSGYPYAELAGVGVAFKLGAALAQKMGTVDSPTQHYLDLVALGSLADMVPVDGENRILAKFGLAALQSTKRVGLQVLLESSGLLGTKRLGTGHVGFTLAPRLNAAGRLGDARWALQLLLTRDPDEAFQIVQHLEAANRERRDLEERIVEEASALVREQVDLEQDRVIVLASPKWHQGVIGIVASRIVERFYRPSIMIALQDGHGKGSARSIPAFHLYDALKRCSQHLLSFGGHQYAAGLKVEEDKIDPLRRELNTMARAVLSPEDLLPRLRIDTRASLEMFDDRITEWLEALGPFGYGNPQPVFLATDLNIVGYPSVVGNNHLRFKVRQGNTVLNSIGFGLGGLIKDISPAFLPTGQAGGGRVNLVFTVEDNDWQGKKQVQLRVKDLEISSR